MLREPGLYDLAALLLEVKIASRYCSLGGWTPARQHCLAYRESSGWEPSRAGATRRIRPEDPNAVGYQQVINRTSTDLCGNRRRLRLARRMPSGWWQTLQVWFAGSVRKYSPSSPKGVR